MKQLIALAIIIVAVNCATDLLCKNPLLEEANNPEAPSDSSTVAAKGKKGMTMCKRFVDKYSCCTDASFADMKKKFAAMKKKFNGKRSKEAGMIKKVNDTMKDAYTLELQETIDESKKLSDPKFMKTESTDATQKKDKEDSKKNWDASLKSAYESADKLSKDLMSTQKVCMKALFKYQAGMMCLACDANYADFIKTNTDGTFTVTVNSKTCTNLKKGCFKYLQSRKDVGAKVKNAASTEESLETLNSMKGSISDIKKCRKKKGGCSDAEIIAVGAKTTAATAEAGKKAKTKKERPDKDKKKQAKDKVKSFQGDGVNMVVKMPTGCTSETDCDWICNKMVNGAGVKDTDDSFVELDDSETERRILATEKVQVAYSATGYEADAEVNQDDFDSTFTETVVADSGANSWFVGLSLIVSLWVMWMK